MAVSGHPILAKPLKIYQIYVFKLKKLDILGIS